MTSGEGCWPEQEAVWTWMKKHGIELTFEQERELKEVVTAPRLEVQRELEARDRCETYPPEWVRVDLMVSPTGEMNAIGGLRGDGPPESDRPFIGLERIKNRYESKLGAVERERDGYRECSEAYYKAMVEIREALGLDEHDVHELVLDTIKGLSSRLRACERLADFWRSIGGESPQFAQAAIDLSSILTADVDELRETENSTAERLCKKPVDQGKDRWSLYCTLPRGHDGECFARVGEGRETLDVPPIARQRCEWREVAEPEETTWESACGGKWVFMVDGPRENNWRYCQGCGKPIEIVP